MASLLISEGYFGSDCTECIMDGSCKHGCMASLLRDAADRIEELLKEREGIPRWISVEDALPEDDVNVLICAVDGDGNTVRAMTSYTHRMYGYNIEGWCPPWQYFSNTYIITHWMPLPEEPKEDANENAQG